MRSSAAASVALLAAAAVPAVFAHFELATPAGRPEAKDEAAVYSAPCGGAAANGTYTFYKDLAKGRVEIRFHHGSNGQMTINYGKGAGDSSTQFNKLIDFAVSDKDNKYVKDVDFAGAKPATGDKGVIQAVFVPTNTSQKTLYVCGDIQFGEDTSKGGKGGNGASSAASMTAALLVAPAAVLAALF